MNIIIGDAGTGHARSSGTLYVSLASYRCTLSSAGSIALQRAGVENQTKLLQIGALYSKADLMNKRFPAMGPIDMDMDC